MPHIYQKVTIICLFSDLRDLRGSASRDKNPSRERIGKQEVGGAVVLSDARDPGLLSPDGDKLETGGSGVIIRITDTAVSHPSTEAASLSTATAGTPDTLQDVTTSAYNMDTPHSTYSSTERGIFKSI